MSSQLRYQPPTARWTQTAHSFMCECGRDVKKWEVVLLIGGKKICILCAEVRGYSPR